MARRKKSIRKSIIMISMVILLTTLLVISSYVFYSWYRSAESSMHVMISDMNKSIQKQIDLFLQEPENMVKSGTVLLESGTIDLENDNELDRYFVSYLSNYDQYIYSYSFGSDSGEYFGARRSETGELQIMKNNHDTGGESWYYAVNPDLSMGEMVTNAGAYDPRTRDWYTIAEDKGSIYFSPVYKHFFMDDLTISVSSPIYVDGTMKGVLGTHVILSYVNEFLNTITSDKNGIAFIYEEDSEYLIGNSESLNNYRIDEGGAFERITPEQTDNTLMSQIIRQIHVTGKQEFTIAGYEVQAVKYSKNGIDWIVVDAIPVNLLFADIKDNISFTILLAVLFILLSALTYFMITRRYFKPLTTLLKVTRELSNGDMTQRIHIDRRDEIGMLSDSFNNMADTILSLVNNLETTVMERTSELTLTNELLRESKEKLSMILNSTAEGILGISPEGICVFCNQQFLGMTGYEEDRHVIGYSVEEIIRFESFSNEAMNDEIDQLFLRFKTGESIHSDSQTLIKSDGSTFDVEIYSYPQYNNDQINGSVVTFLDVTERKETEKHIVYLNSHDFLTGLYNRRFFEESIRQLDTQENLPISIIFGDINGLKLTNDVFGHTLGDELIKRCGGILQKICSDQGLVARIGGDEFVILLPRTEDGRLAEIVKEIHDKIALEKVGAVQCSMAIGAETKTQSSEDLTRVMEDAENKMYHEKTTSKTRIDNEMILTIISSLHEKDPRQEDHSILVSRLCTMIAQEMGLNEADIRRVKELGYLHDIGKIVLSDEVLAKEHDTMQEEMEENNAHPVVGYRIFNLFDKTLDIGESVYAHHENWDGTGYPKHLKGKEIPLYSRIVAVADRYATLSKNIPLTKADPDILAQMKLEAGSILDPEIVDVFIGGILNFIMPHMDKEE